MSGPRRAGLTLGTILSAALLWACGDSSVGPSPPDVEVVVAGGDAQYGTAGQLLEQPLRALVRRTQSGTAQPDITVLWSVEEGDATLGGAAATVTDSTGMTSQTLRLGNTPGMVRVRVTVERQQTATAEFLVYLVAPPEVTGLSTDSASAGDTIAIVGANFSTTAEEDVVLFSGIRGRTLSAAPTELQVEVPACLPSRTVAVIVRLGSVGSTGLPLTVGGGTQVTTMNVGHAIDVDDPMGLTCLRLAGDSARYLVVVSSASSVGAASYGFSLTGLADGGRTPVSAPTRSVAAPRESAPLDFAEMFERSLRLQEAALVKERMAATPSPRPQTAAAAVPTVGDRRTFKVLKSGGGFDDVTAVARYVGKQAALYVDESAPAGGFDDADLDTLSSEFDDVIYPTVTSAFGVPSDIDGNSRIVILLTPAVNRLTPRGSGSFIGGFFFGLDLQDGEGSNHGEVFYALVPDPTGQYSDARSKSRVMDVVPAILAHEFQHMVHFNERVLKLKATNTEALWLSEGLAQMAEELVARAYEARGEPMLVERHREGNRNRARRFLADPGAVSLIVTTGQGSLEERGAGWLHVLYLWDRGGGTDILRRLTQTTRTGIDNVTAVIGESWPDLVADWEAALYADDRVPGSAPYQYPHVSLRDLLSMPGTSYPLVPEVLGGADFTRAGSLWSSSAHHYIVVPPSEGSIVLRLGGEDGGNAPEAEQLRLRVIRLS
ncbi:MAG: IPT/TIG domain-containing protein [Gemmatimonadetes bacterium]|nr:IPT/TIG domain-containing protein [Gemmatimonadota bacterium]